MKSIIIPAVKSLTITNKYPNKSINEDTISVGSDGKYEYYSYLFFDISSIPSNVIISTAKLTLFKVDNFFKDMNKKFSMSPLHDYFSTYTTYNNPSHYDHYTVINFYPLTPQTSVSVDITTIVSSWIKNSLKNKGIILYGRNENTLMGFGSVKSSDNYLVPFILINYETYPSNKCCEKNSSAKCYENNCCEKFIKICKEDFEEMLFKVCKEACKEACVNNCNPYPPNTSITRAVTVTGIVAPLSIYYLVANLQVTRVSNGQINNYYVTDEFDNSLNITPLSVDKTYNIAISPPIQTGDKENIILYGSYKGF